ncbi:MAG: hypothetical protein ACKVU1_02965 [bacterium]
MRAITNGSRSALLLAILVVLTHGYFYNGAGWNQGARLGSIFAFVEPGPDQWSFRIDRFLKDAERGIVTGDWARVGDTHYSNKAPGTTFLGVPWYFALFHLERAAGVDPTSPRWTLVNGYALSLVCGALWVAAAAAAFVRFLVGTRRWTERDALAAACVFAFATLVFPFDSSLWGHPAAAACGLLGAIFLLRAADDAHGDDAHAQPRARARTNGSSRDLALAGFFSAMALLTEYLSGISLVAAAAYVLLARRLRPRAALFFLGAAIPVAALLIYQKSLFGGFLTTATSLQNPGFLGARRGEAMFGAPSLEIAAAMLVSLHRGLFVFMPVLVFAVFGALRLARSRASADRGLVALCAANTLGAILAVSCFKAGWHGGDSAGPRYLIGSIPFWCLLLPQVSSLSRAAGAAFAVASALSLANMLVINATTTMVPSDVPNPLFGALYGALLRGEIGARAQVFSLGGVAFGYEGMIALAPLVVVLGAGGWVLLRVSRAPRASRTAHASFCATPNAQSASSPRAIAEAPPPADAQDS